MYKGVIIPRKYFVVQGKGLSKVSPLMAFDKALREAGISHLNLVPVSSILPPNIEEESYRKLPPGAITFLVMSEHRVKGPARISVGISWARGKPHGYVLEIHSENDGVRLVEKLSQMWAEIRERKEIEFEEPRVLVEDLEVPEGYYGSAVVALVFSEVEII